MRSAFERVLRRVLQRAWWRPQAGPLVWALWPLSLIYGLLWRLRRWAYAAGWLRSQPAPVPVVVVGNLIVGGAGKTPTVIALVQGLRAHGWRPGVVSRGYGSAGEGPRAVSSRSDPATVGDEPLLIARRTQVPVWVGRDRVAAARALCAAQPEVDILVSDDGLQHIALAHDAAIVVFDERGLGNGHLLPAGPLREPFAARPPKRTLVLYNAAVASTHWPGVCARRGLSGAVPLKAWWAGEAATPAGLQALKSSAVVAAAGIASPQRFFSMLENAGLQFTALPLPDHAVLEPRPWPADAGAVLVTEKDAVKLRPDAPDADTIHVAALDFQLPAETLQTLLGWLDPPKPR